MALATPKSKRAPAAPKPPASKRPKRQRRPQFWGSTFSFMDLEMLARYATLALAQPLTVDDPEVSKWR